MSTSAKLLNKLEDIKWLFETHLKNIEHPALARELCKAFIIVGNEDAPELIELYDHDPKLGDQPFYIWRDSSSSWEVNRIIARVEPYLADAVAEGGDCLEQ